MKSYLKLSACALSVCLVATSIAADARPNRVRASGPNGTVTAVNGPNGSAVRGRGAVQNQDGSVTAASGGAGQTANGASGNRRSRTTVNPDGSATRAAQANVSGANGSAATSSNVTRNADGSYSGGRFTTATSAATGNTYNGSTQIDPATGKPVHTGTCTNASGVVIPCTR